MNLMHSFGLFDFSADSASLLIIGRIPFSPLPGDLLGMCWSSQLDSLAIFLHSDTIFLFLLVDSCRRADKKMFCCSDFFLIFFGVELFFFGIVIFARRLVRSGYFDMIGST